MTPNAALLSSCLQEIEDALGWGPSARWTNRDFDTLAERMAEVTDLQLSPTTLKRVWGRVKYASSPSVTTLDALAVFAGYAHWRAFRQQAAHRAAGTGEQPPPALRQAKNPARLYLYYLLPLAALAALIAFFSADSAPVEAPTLAAATDLDPADYSFSFRPVSSGVPNSVVFHYDAAAAPVDSVYLQQSWDARRRERISREENVHTSIYYLPGFYRAKLVVRDQVVQERDLYLRSQGWVCAVAADPVPVYLPEEEATREGRIGFTADQLTTLGIPLQPRPPVTVLTNVGRLDGLYSDDFHFRTRLRHDYATGSSACQQARLLLLLKNDAIIIPLSRPGCVADLQLLAGGRTFDGRTHDLTAFGVVNDQWLEVECTGKDGLLTFSVDGRTVFQVESEEDPKEFVGVRYEFTGLGSVDDLSFSNDAGVVWADTF